LCEAAYAPGTFFSRNMKRVNCKMLSVRNVKTVSDFKHGDPGPLNRYSVKNNTF
jgi:hypothetical protein